APTAAGHDRMLAVQSEVHGTLSPWWRDRNFIASLLIVLSEGTWRKGVATRRTMYGTCLHASDRAAAARARYIGAPNPKAAVAGGPARTAGFNPSRPLSLRGVKGSSCAGFRMPARRELSTRAEGRRPKASREGTRGRPCGRLPFMGICRCGGLGRGCAGRRSWHRIDDRSARIVVAAAADGAILA